MARRTKPTIDDELIDKLLEGREHGAGLLGNDGLIGELKKRLAERMLAAELDVHLEDEEQKAAGNHRNGYSSKTVTMAEDRVVLDIPRDRHGQFDPALIPKYARRFPGFDEKIIALYARGMSTRDIQAHIDEIYGVRISANLVSAVTEAVMDEATAWQNRPLEATYAIVYFDALRVKIRDEGLVRNKAVYLAIGVTCEGTKEILGLWIEQTEGAKFWMRVMTELKSRGTSDILIAVVDGLKGFPEAITGELEFGPDRRRHQRLAAVRVRHAHAGQRRPDFRRRLQPLKRPPAVPGTCVLPMARPRQEVPRGARTGLPSGWPRGTGLDG